MSKELLGLILVFGFTFFGAGYGVGKHDERLALAKCEEELPRNQSCVLTAVPKQDAGQ
jgi:hypothetical protein